VSLCVQTHLDWEGLVVDDGEGEGVAAALALGDPRVFAFQNPGRGQVDARNAALDKATGTVAMWLDDDDWLEDPRHLARVVAALRVGPALVTRGGWMVETEPGDAVRPIERGRIAFDLPTDAATLQRDNTVLTAGLAYPLALHRLLGPLDRELDGYFDWDWHLRVIAAGVPVVRLPGLGVVYRQHAGNRSGRVTDERRRSFARLVQKHGLVTEFKDHAGVLANRPTTPAPPPRTPSGSPRTAADGPARRRGWR
jgi:glycosyltransferase involved in cell wall biosynthesis